MKTYKIKATVVTPFSIGDGSQYSPNKDYYIDKGNVCYIDEQKMGELLAKDDELMTEYVDGVVNMEGNRSKFDLKSVIQNRLFVRREQFIQTELHFNGNELSRLPINGFVKTPNGQPYTPCSSINGAMQSAWVDLGLEK